MKERRRCARDEGVKQQFGDVGSQQRISTKAELQKIMR